MKAACIWDVLAHILSNSTCNKRNMEFSPQVSINKTTVSSEYALCSWTHTVLWHLHNLIC